jgi:Na+/H+ antiporter NhaC
MMDDAPWLSLIPPATAIGLALWRKKILPALFVGILVGEILLADGAVLRAFFSLLDHTVRITGETGNLQLVFFSLLVGGLIALIRESGGFSGFARTLEGLRADFGKGTVYALTWGIGAAIFLENWSNVLINGTTVGPLYDRIRVSRERMAYFIHTISINTVAIVVVNSWGAFYMTLLLGQGVEEPFGLVVRSVPFNLYSLASLALVALVMATGLTIGPMRAAARRVAAGGAGPRPGGAPAASAPRFVTRAVEPSLVHMLFPVAVLLGSVLVGLWTTGQGDLARGNGTASIFYAVCVSILLTAVLLRVRRVFRLDEILDVTVRGMGEFLEIAILIVLALTLGDVCKQAGTGTFLGEMARQGLPGFLVPAVVFALGAVMSFATGTSYGTFSILVPIALPMADAVGLDPALLFGACIAGGVFGDNASPISDTTIVTSMATGVPVVEHVKTQLPYALVAASLAVGGYLVLGLVG